MTDKFSPQLIKEFLSTLPSQMQNFNQQMISDLQPKLEQWLRSLNLVTREEFDCQTRRLSEALAELEQIKQSLSNQQSSKSSLELEQTD